MTGILNIDNPFGFGPQLYEYSSFGPKSPRILSCYVESGIPVVVALSNVTSESPERLDSEAQRVNHAVLCIGHKDVEEADLENALKARTNVCNASYGSVSVLDYDDIDKRFVFIDDNCPPYQTDFLSTPANRYHRQQYWNNCHISNFIAPLYKRIYMEPFVAKEYAMKILLSDYYSHLKEKKIVVRTYLCSTRSFRHFVNTSTMTNDMKDVILSGFMPKFVWITEISEAGDFAKGLVENLIVIDATGCETSNFNPLIVAFVDQACFLKDNVNKVLNRCAIPTCRFNSYSNLK